MPATARVRVVVEVTLGQPWSGATRLEEVYEQARKDALDALGNAIAEAHECCRIVGIPVVEAIITKEG